MDRYRLKNIIIVILLLANAFLLGVLSMRQTSENASHRQTSEQLVKLFAADGMSLKAEDIPSKTAPAGQSLARDMDREREVAAFFVGKNPVRADQGGDLYSYTGAAGGAARTNGMRYVTVSNSFEFFRNTKSDHLIAEGRIKSRGRTICVAEVEIHDGLGKLLCSGTFTLFCTGKLDKLPED